MQKTITKGLLTVVALLCAMPAGAYYFYAENEDGINIYYSFLDTADKEVMVAEADFFDPYVGYIRIPNSVKYNNTTYAVTYIGGYTFRNNTDVTGIELPDYLKCVYDYAFAGCTNVTALTLPSTMIQIGEYAFQNTGLRTITIPNSVTTIGEGAFDSCEDLEAVVISSSVPTIGNYAFWFCTNLKEVLSLNPTPPSCSQYTFGYVDTSSCVLYVPAGAIDSYATADVWKEFSNIRDVSTSGIASAATEEKEVVGYYTVGGQRVSAPQRGINIVRYSDGTTKKILVP